jgi:tetratricopeptide (TPR) repeat protein
MGRVEAAVTAFEDALRRDSADAETVQELFFTWMELGNEREARDVLERARRHLPNDPELFRAEGLALTRLGRHPESVSALQQVVLLRPEDGQAHLDLASARFRAGDYADAFEDYEHALQRLDDEDRRRPILMCQAMCRLEQGRPSEAVQVLRRVVQNDPADLRARMHLGSALEAAAEYEEAIRCYDEIATQAEDDPTGVTLGGQALYAKAKTCFMHLDDHTSGLDAIDTLVALAGKTGIAAGRRLARELQQAGRPEAARVVSEECDAVESIL